MKQIKTFNNLFKFYETGKFSPLKCVCPQEECDCHYSGTFTVVSAIEVGFRYKTRDITVYNGIIVSVSEESDWKT